MINYAIAEHYTSVDLAIRNLVDLYNKGYDISNRDLFNTVLARYGLLNDGFCSEEEYIVQEVTKRIW